MVNFQEMMVPRAGEKHQWDNQKYSGVKQNRHMPLPVSGTIPVPLPTSYLESDDSHPSPLQARNTSGKLSQTQQLGINSLWIPQHNAAPEAEKDFELQVIIPS